MQLLLILLLFTLGRTELHARPDRGALPDPYLLAAGCALKLATPTARPAGTATPRRGDMVIAAPSDPVYTVFLVYAAGLESPSAVTILYAPGAILYIIARRERGLRLFPPGRGGAVRRHRHRRAVLGVVALVRVRSDLGKGDHFA